MKIFSLSLFAQRRVCQILTIATFAVPSSAYATKNVTSPYVTPKGNLSLEWRGGYEIDHDDGNGTGFRNQLIYGFTDYYELKISLDGRDFGDTEFTDVDFENKFQLTPKGEYWVDLGTRLDYTKNLTGDPDRVGLEILFGKVIGGTRQMLNLEVDKEIGAGADKKFDYGLSYMAAYRLSENLELGGEYYADYGSFSGTFEDQDHLLGPVLYGEAFGFRYQVGVLGGLTDATADALVKTNIRYNF